MTDCLETINESFPTNKKPIKLLLLLLLLIERTEQNKTKQNCCCIKKTPITGTLTKNQRKNNSKVESLK